jgi:hypothetical protein
MRVLSQLTLKKLNQKSKVNGLFSIINWNCSNSKVQCNHYIGQNIFSDSTKRKANSNRDLDQLLSSFLCYRLTLTHGILSSTGGLLYLTKSGAAKMDEGRNEFWIDERKYLKYDASQSGGF